MPEIVSILETASASVSWIEQSQQDMVEKFIGGSQWLLEQIMHPLSYGNYMTVLVVLSLLVYAAELLFPWRKNQAKIRHDFFLDAFYMFFNFFLIGIFLLAPLSTVCVTAVDAIAQALGFEQPLSSYVGPDFLLHLSSPLTLFCLFIVRDFLQWLVHYTLHAVPVLWRFHKVHHSIREMGFAGHLRYHWVENIVYNSATYIPLALLGFNVADIFSIAVFTTLVGHLNHANINMPLGALRYVLNNPQMHIWHHAKTLPKDHPRGMNYGITLSCWDYIFKTAAIPSDGRDIELGFDGSDTFPTTFVGHAISGFTSDKDRS